MNSDDFEKRIQRQTIRPIPAEWRREILDQATSVSRSQLKPQTLKIKTFLNELLWPCPQAWAGLAAVWIVILFINVSSHEENTIVAQNTLIHSPESVVALKKEWTLAELKDARQTPVAERPRTHLLRPHSERREEFSIA